MSKLDDVVQHAREFVDSGQLDEHEGYKYGIIEELGRARDAVLSGDSEWPALVNKALTNNLTNWRIKDVLVKWFESQPDNAREALQALWADDNTPPGERIRAFLDQAPAAPNFKGVGTRLSPVSVLLMALGTEYPPYRSRPFTKVYDDTGYPRPPRGADEGGHYEHALAFLDQFIERSAGTISNRLDAQGIVWWRWVIRDQLEKQQEPAPPDPEPVITAEQQLNEVADLETLADELLLDIGFLRRIEALLADKGQVIFQGPPGTGKTFVARKLAVRLAGSPERVRLVQFHPSYAYEDFVQGFRPALDGGAARFTLRDGPLLAMARRARNRPDAKHFLVIDEINRGNLAKVFGELYFLLEYRDEPMRLQYSESEFSLPDNLYIIGTMNTADRSIALVDLAFRRRFHFVEFHPGKWPVQGLLGRWLERNAPGMEWVAGVVDRANEELGEDNSEAAIGPSYFMKSDLTNEQVSLIWEHNVRPYVEEQLYGQRDRLAEFDLDALRGEADGAGGEQDDEAESRDAAD
ncbi:MAG: AAA family ATPase [Chloroflexota bacterium]|nr:AAA family ATPase [Chloroflexota bacterium]